MVWYFLYNTIIYLAVIDLGRGGYLLIPHTFEFFQRQRDWISDRIQFRRLLKNGNVSVLDDDESATHQTDDDWVFERLAPWFLDHLHDDDDAFFWFHE